MSEKIPKNVSKKGPKIIQKLSTNDPNLVQISSKSQHGPHGVPKWAPNGINAPTRVPKCSKKGTREEPTKTQTLQKNWQTFVRKLAKSTEPLGYGVLQPLF